MIQIFCEQQGNKLKIPEADSSRNEDEEESNPKKPVKPSKKHINSEHKQAKESLKRHAKTTQNIPQQIASPVLSESDDDDDESEILSHKSSEVLQFDSEVEADSSPPTPLEVDPTDHILLPSRAKDSHSRGATKRPTQKPKSAGSDGIRTPLSSEADSDIVPQQR